jgi:hypothetical protein
MPNLVRAFKVSNEPNLGFRHPLMAFAAQGMGACPRVTLRHEEPRPDEMPPPPLAVRSRAVQATTSDQAR